jgi:hypothetical protein
MLVRQGSVFQSKDEPEAERDRQERRWLLSGMICEEESSRNQTGFGLSGGMEREARGRRLSPPCLAHLRRSVPHAMVP